MSDSFSRLHTLCPRRYPAAPSRWHLPRRARHGCQSCNNCPAPTTAKSADTRNSHIGVSCCSQNPWSVPVPTSYKADGRHGKCPTKKKCCNAPVPRADGVRNNPQPYTPHSRRTSHSAESWYGRVPYRISPSHAPRSLPAFSQAPCSKLRMPAT